MAIETATRVPVAGLIVQSTFTSIGDMARLVVPGLPLGWLLPVKMKSADKLRGLHVPKLHFHGEEDDVVPLSMGQALFAAAAPPKRFVAFKNVAHNDWPGSYKEQWLAEIARFLDQTVPKT